MEFQQYTSVEIKGVVFDGTFESSLDIANFLREHAQHRVSLFSIEHYNSGSRLGETNLSFVLEPQKGNSNSKPITYVLRVGDLFRVQASNFEVIKRDVVAKYWSKKNAE